MATITFFPEGTAIPNSRNTASVDGAKPFSILGSMFKYYKLDKGEHSVVITSSNGECWEVSGYVGYTDCLNVKVQVDRNDNIVGVSYKVAPEPPTVLFPKKLPK